jgi:hypothetical protein
MALDQSALLELLEALKAADVDERIRQAATTIYQALIEAELTAVIGAAPHERAETRLAQRNGHRSKTISTVAGDLELRIPKLRAGSFFPSLTGEPDRTVPDFAVSRTNPVDAAAADGQLTGGADRSADYQHWLRDGGHGVIVAVGPRLVAAGAATDTNLHHLTVGDQRDAEPALRSVFNSLPGP